MNATEFVCAVATGLAAGECSELAPWLARRLVVWSAHARYRDAEWAAVRAEELQAVLADRPTRLLKLATALAFTLAAVATLTTRATRHATSHASRAASRASRAASRASRAGTRASRVASRASYAFRAAARASRVVSRASRAAARASRAGSRGARLGRRAAVRARVRAGGVMAATAGSSGVLTYCLLSLNDDPSGGLAVGVTLSGLGLAGTWRLSRAVRRVGDR
ncbi:hypothetical protein [Actinomadura rayongensis]|uniref:Uncharacterized protein n=1 Tax=Actinomadura rayongensis TaxID=1429076 RepID=A0A6I4W4U5_9ACTN|nr:hypothetical protein [Actinomadura rayongensis]MXQ63226.1 hypothetical protein [Actinomadura rayongensis]